MRKIKTISIKDMFIISLYEKGNTLESIAQSYKYRFGGSITRQRVHQIIKTTNRYKEMRKQLEDVKPITCLRCGWTWTPRKVGKPKVCPHCISAYYEMPAKAGKYRHRVENV